MGFALNAMKSQKLLKAERRPRLRCQGDKIPVPKPLNAPPPWLIPQIDENNGNQDGDRPVAEIIPPGGETVWPPQEQENDKKKDEGERGVVIIDYSVKRR